MIPTFPRQLMTALRKKEEPLAKIARHINRHEGTLIAWLEGLNLPAPAVQQQVLDAIRSYSDPADLAAEPQELQIKGHILLSPQDWLDLDELRGGLSRSEWVQERIQEAKCRNS